jgi:hypothetical protein
MATARLYVWWIELLRTYELRTSPTMWKWIA